MALYTDPTAFAAHIESYGKKINEAGPRALKAAAAAATRDIREEATHFHIGKRKLGAGFQIYGDKAIISARGRGAWTIVEKGTKEHDVYPRRRRRRGKNRGALVVPGYGFFAKVHVKGAHPLGRPWEIGVARADVSGKRAYRAEIVKVFT